ncbi:helicase-exonuclease AddAB subunit AddA [Paenibacillus periandrae]|uniref:helicase-exonuclease AddAB subunit AddA n=1 Tax=Paenibacillus periandrae TaxID=1761741 RepID=UPI001F0892FA|nr:helicase-exonuclease AddAB subunit AddA [Paenibacillus periandrae]
MTTLSQMSIWTDQQSQAISYVGSDTLVSAAAGSGKTAVLVERIVKKVRSPKEKTNVNQLLVATFTKAAAAEMKERIREELEKEVFKNPNSKHLKKQLALLPQATITTVHSFCKNVIQRYYERIGLDPSFRIANETEAAILRQDVLEDIIEECHQKVDNMEFSMLLDWFSGDRNDNSLLNLVQMIYDSARSHPSPEAWLTHVVSMYDLGEDSIPIWVSCLMEDVKLELESIKNLLQEAVLIIHQPEGPTPYLDNLMKELSVLTNIMDSSTSWDNLHTAMHQSIFDRLKACKKDGYDEVKIEAVKALRDRAKKDLEKLKGEIFQRSIQDFILECQHMKPVVLGLKRLVMEFHTRFSKAKTEKNLLDFSDLEHMALMVLGEIKDGRYEPTKAAHDYRKIYNETLIDEYQDTNRVQETILSLVSRESHNGNRFMVGDVKQSIYRFRLAEPRLFLEKYAAFGEERSLGQRIELTKNFRSRKQVLDATNFIFRQIMSQRVAEVAYTPEVELSFGATYYPDTTQDYTVDVHVIDRNQHIERDRDNNLEDTHPGDMMLEMELEESEPARLEARYIAEQIKNLIGQSSGRPYYVYDKQIQGLRPIQYRDIVIILRSTQNWSPVILDEFKMLQIPAYADLSTGYFGATEVSIMMSLLTIIDNPYQDIHLAGVLRSPLVGLSADELAQVRHAKNKGRFYGAVQRYIEMEESVHTEAAAAIEDETHSLKLRAKLENFLNQLDEWRNQARSGSLSDLIGNIFEVTGFYEFAGGLAGGQQRQANLRALFDRARQFESTSFRGLFRFLRFIERMKESGTDMGAARSLGENEDVVRIISIHKSKGLEFPVVFVAGLGKKFNQQDLVGKFLLHKEMGFGPKYSNPVLRLSYPSLPSLAIKRRMRLELLAEEMRVLYVAMTRAREKLFLVGSAKNTDDMLKVWSKAAVQTTSSLIPDYLLTKCNSFLDWIMMALSRHSNCSSIFGWEQSGLEDVSEWRVSMSSTDICRHSQPTLEIIDLEEKNKFLYSISRNQPIMIEVPSEQFDRVNQLGWNYNHMEATKMFSKTSVTEMKRLGEAVVIADESSTGRIKASQASQTLRAPKFISTSKFSAAEKGTFYHTVMQNFPLDSNGVDAGKVLDAIARMVERKLLTDEQAGCIDPVTILDFFSSSIGLRLLKAKEVLREIPFSYGIKAKELYPDAIRAEDEIILIQGVIDCLFVDEQDLTVLLDFKTDQINQQSYSEMSEKYKFQISLYRKAINQVWSTVDEAFLYFFDKGMLIEM